MDLLVINTTDQFFLKSPPALNTYNCKNWLSQSCKMYVLKRFWNGYLDRKRLQSAQTSKNEYAQRLTLTFSKTSLWNSILKRSLTLRWQSNESIFKIISQGQGQILYLKYCVNFTECSINTVYRFFSFSLKGEQGSNYPPAIGNLPPCPSHWPECPFQNQTVYGHNILIHKSFADIIVIVNQPDL